MSDQITKKLDQLTFEGMKDLRNKDVEFLKEMKAQEKEWERLVLEGKAKVTETEETKVYVNVGHSRYVIDNSYQTLKKHYERI